MAATVLPSFFVDVYNVTFTPTGGSSSAISIFAVKSIGIDRQQMVLKGQDNNKLRPVAAHTVAINDTVTIESEDGAALENLLTVAGQGALSFNWRAAAHNVETGTPLVDQTVTIGNLIMDKKSLKQPTKAFGSFQISGFIMESATGDTTEPIAFTTATSPASNAAN